MAIAKVVVEVWQVEQSAEVATCDGKEVLDSGVTPRKLWPLWQVMQLFMMPK